MLHKFISQYRNKITLRDFVAGRVHQLILWETSSRRIFH